MTRGRRSRRRWRCSWHGHTARQRIDRGWIREMNAAWLQRYAPLRTQPALGLVVIVAAVTYVMMREPRDTAALICLASILYGIYLALNVPVRLLVRTCRILWSTRNGLEEQIQFNSAGYLVRWPTKTTSIAWSDLRKVIYGNIGLTLVRKGVFHFISKRSFANESDFEELRQFFKDHLPALLCEK